MSEQGEDDMKEERSAGKVGGLWAEVRVQPVNVFMEKWGLSTRPNQGPVGSFTGAERQLWMP